MADTPKRVIRLIDNIKLELYEEGRKKYVQIWDPTGNNTYNEGDDGPSGIKSPEKSKKQASAEDDNNVIHLAIGESQIVEHYRVAANRSKSGKIEDIKPYFTYLQDPFSETPPPKRVYGGGGLGTPEVDNVGPTPYYLNNGCKVNIKWIGMIPNPDFQLGTFSTPSAQERYNLSLNPSGPPRYLYDRPILSDVDNTFGEKISDDDFQKHLRPQSEWFIYPANAAIDDTIGPFDPDFEEDDVVVGKTYSVNYKDKPILMDKIVSITLPTGFAENGGKGYLQWSGPGTDKGLIYSTAPKTFTSKENNPLLKLFSNSDIGMETDKNILYTIIQAYKTQVKTVSSNAGEIDLVSFDYDLKVCFPDTGTCSPIPYRSPITPFSTSLITSPIVVVGVTPSTIPKKVKLNVFGLPGVTSLSGETDGSIKVKVKVSLPDFTVYLGDPPGSTGSDATGLNPFGLVDDEPNDEDIYFETDAIITEEQQISLDLITYSAQGDSEGTEDVTPGSTETPGTTGAPVNTNGSNAGGEGERRFQQQLTIRGKVVKNGEIPMDLLGKVVIGKSGYLLEKHAAVKFAALSVAYKANFGADFVISGPYRTIKVSNDIFDWDYFNKFGKGRKKGTNGGTAAAKPGTSKHGWGQAMDLGGFGNGPGNAKFDWMEANAKKYGWINPAWAKKAGAGHEPWHWEYIGDDLFAA